MHRQASAALTLARNYEALGDVVLGTIQEGLPRVHSSRARGGCASHRAPLLINTAVISPFVAATYCFGSGEDQFPTLSVTCDGLPSCGDPAHPFWLSVRKRSLVR